MNNKIKIAILGLGKMGKNHLKHLIKLREVEIAFIYDLNKDISNKFSKQYNIVVSTNLDDDLPKIDGVIIATPTSTHQEYIKKVSKYIKIFL